MMHRHGWKGPQAPSNTCFAWFVWDERAGEKRIIDWFDWNELAPNSDVKDLSGASRIELPAVA
jgi:hypothetical protein